MDTLDLRALEEAELITRTVYPSVPVKVEYELTAEGQRLIPVVNVMKEFGLPRGELRRYVIGGSNRRQLQTSIDPRTIVPCY